MKSELSRLLITRDPTLAEVVLASAAALGAHVAVARDAENLRRVWRTAGAVLVGADAAELVLSLRLTHRPRVFLVGTRADALAPFSVPLKAAVIVLPESSGVLAGVLSDQSVATETKAVWLLGAGGGLGCSVLAGTLAAVAARKNRVAAVELDPYGGLDLLFGVEQQQGWRWPELSAAVGQLDTLSGQVPNGAGVDVIAMGRGGFRPPPPEAIRSVTESLARTHDVVVFDGGRDRPPPEGTTVWLVVGGDIRSVAAAQILGDEVDLADAEVVVRTGPGRSIAPELVADTLGLPLAGAVPTQRKIPRMVEAGRTPGSVGGRYRSAVERLWRRLR